MVADLSFDGRGAWAQVGHGPPRLKVNTPELARRLLNRGADAVAVAKRALRDKRGDVLRGLDVLTGDIPAEQREKLLALNAKAFPAIQASVEAKQRLAQVVLVTAVRVALPGEP